jgi:hypothetical protein
VGAALLFAEPAREDLELALAAVDVAVEVAEPEEVAVDVPEVPPGDVEVLLRVVVVIEETPADCVAVEPLPQPASAAVAAMAAQVEAILFVRIDRLAYLGGQLNRAELHLPRQAPHLARVDQPGAETSGGLRAAGDAEAQALIG